MRDKGCLSPKPDSMRTPPPLALRPGVGVSTDSGVPRGELSSLDQDTSPPTSTTEPVSTAMGPLATGEPSHPTTPLPIGNDAVVERAAPVEAGTAVAEGLDVEAEEAKRGVGPSAANTTGTADDEGANDEGTTTGPWWPSMDPGLSGDTGPRPLGTPPPGNPSRAPELERVGVLADGGDCSPMGLAGDGEAATGISTTCAGNALAYTLVSTTQGAVPTPGSLPLATPLAPPCTPAVSPAPPPVPPSCTANALRGTKGLGVRMPRPRAPAMPDGNRVRATASSALLSSLSTWPSGCLGVRFGDRTAAPGALAS